LELVHTPWLLLEIVLLQSVVVPLALSIALFLLLLLGYEHFGAVGRSDAQLHLQEHSLSFSVESSVAMLMAKESQEQSGQEWESSLALAQLATVSSSNLNCHSWSVGPQCCKSWQRYGIRNCLVYE